MKLSRAIKTIKYLRRDKRVLRSTLKVLSFKPPLCWFINTPLYNFIYEKRVRSQIKSKKTLASFIIETTSLCNARCVMCPHIKMKRKKTIMEEKLFRKIIGELKDIKTERIILSAMGEPLLDPNIVERIKYIKTQIKNCKIKMHTNGSLLFPAKADLLIESGIDDIIFSINGINKSYERVMGLKFDQTVKNLKYFLKKKPKSLHVHLSCMFVNENAEDIKKLINYWDKYVDSIAINMPENWAGKKEIATPFTLPYKIKKWPCKGVFDTFNIFVNGDVVLCCRDYEGSLVLGNVAKQTVKEILHNPLFNRIKKLHFEGKMDEIPICRGCDTPIMNATSWW